MRACVVDIAVKYAPHDPIWLVMAGIAHTKYHAPRAESNDAHAKYHAPSAESNDAKRVVSGMVLRSTLTLVTP